jgi:putative SOS response-associated peptidase YedK
MCGRFTITKQVEDIENSFDVELDRELYKLNYNVAPTQDLPVVTNQQNKQVSFLKWGLVPSWSKDLKFGSKMINARIETITEKPSFKKAIQERRCVVIADGYYEWKKTSQGKEPYYITMENSKLFSFGGIWEKWTSPVGETVKTFSIITQPSFKEIEHIHNRMPLQIMPEQKDYWLSAETGEEALDFAIEHQKNKLKSYVVSTQVNSVTNNFPDLLNPLSD